MKRHSPHLVFRLALLLLLLTPVSAFAQDTTHVGIAVGNNVFSVIWQPNQRWAFRPEISFATTSASNSVTGTESSSFQSTPGFSGLFYIGKWDALRTYVSPRYAYQRLSQTDTTGGGVSTTTSTGSHTVSGSLGAEYSLNQRFGFFGEVGVALGFASVEPVSTHNSNLRTSVGAILFF